MRSSYRVLPLNIEDAAKAFESVPSPWRFRTYLIVELLLCTMWLTFGIFSPLLIPHFQTIRPIPYQVLSTGDVILDFRLSADVVVDVTVSSRMLLITCLLLPLVVVVTTASFATPRSLSYRIYDLHAIFCVLCTALGFSEFITNFLKMYVGRLRPNFYSLCEFSTEALKCAADEWKIEEARKSFPSGHSSFSFCGMGVVVFFFLGRIGPLYNRIPIEQDTTDLFTRVSYSRRKLFVLLSYSPWLYSSFVACSRLVDNWHHPSDIIAGALIGMLSSYVAYHLWYPPFSSPYSGVPIIGRVVR